MYLLVKIIVLNVKNFIESNFLKFDNIVIC